MDASMAELNTFVCLFGPPADIFDGHRGGNWKTYWQKLNDRNPAYVTSVRTVRIWPKSYSPNFLQEPLRALYHGGATSTWTPGTTTGRFKPIWGRI